MIENRSVPVNTLLPHIAYQDLTGAVEWLKKSFGFQEYYRYGDPVGGVMMRSGAAYMMLKASAARAMTKSMLTVFVEDVDAHYEKAKASGAVIFEELNETYYGERQYGAEDVEGHRWLFSEHAKDVDPAEWGAAAKADPSLRS